MPKAKRSRNKKSGKAVKILAVILVLIIIAVALTPFLTTYITDEINKSKWNSATSTNTAINNETVRGDLTELDPNYVLNKTADKTFKINDCSYLDYKPTYTSDKTANGESYNTDNGDITLNIIATNETGYSISNQNMIITYYAERDDPNQWAIIGGIGGAIVGGALIGGIALANEWNPVGWVITGVLVGAIVGGILGHYLGDANTLDQIVICDHETKLLNQGDNLNSYSFGSIAGLTGYTQRHLLIEMPEDTLDYYSDFAVTNEIMFNYNANVYIRLVNGDQRLLEIQKEIKNDTVNYQGFRNADIYSMGQYDNDYDGYGGHDSFIGINTCNYTGGDFKAKVSTHDNIHVFHVSEKRSIKTKDITGIDNHVYPKGYFSFQPVIYDNTGTIIDAEIGYASWDITDIHNVSKFGTGYTVTLASNNNYIVNFHYTVSITDTTSLYDTDGNKQAYFYSLCIVLYQVGISSYGETLGLQKIVFDTSQFKTTFEYAYNNFFSTNQTIHRTFVDTNDKLQIMCDFNSPFYITDKSQVDFKVRFFIATNLNTVFATPGGLYPVWIRLSVLDGSDVILTYYSTSMVQRTGISSEIFSFSINGKGIEELKSYQLKIECASGIAGLFGTHNIATYSVGLYYILNNYNEFMDDIKDLEDLLASLKNASDVQSSTYDYLKEVMGIMKSKMSDLESSKDTLKSANKDKYDDLTDKLDKTIKNFKECYIWLMDFMDNNKAPISNAKFSEFKSLINNMKFYYADSFTLYNAYVCDLKGEHQIADDIQNKTKKYEEIYNERHNRLRNNNYGKYLPSVILLMVLLISFIITMIFYYTIRNKFKSKSKLWLGITMIIIFSVSAITLYLFLNSISWTVLAWLYGV